MHPLRRIILSSSSQAIRRSQASRASPLPRPRLAPRSPSSTANLAKPRQRLSLIARHLQPRPELALNTPFSTERQSAAHDDLPYAPLTRPPPAPASSSSPSPSAAASSDGASDPTAAAMSSSQPPHPTLLIPGPVEFDDAVLHAMGHFSESHMAPTFAATFAGVLARLRALFQTSDPASRPLVVSGSGTLGWDFVAANITEPGDKALVLHTGYFADSFADCFATYGVRATQLRAPIGDRPSLDEIEAALTADTYKVLTVTHVDTSTGVRSDVAGVAALARRVSPATLLVVDGVCSVGCEELRFDAWGVDVALTASQKAIGAPAGLCIAMVADRAMKAFEARTHPPGSYFASFANWMPGMAAGCIGRGSIALTRGQS